MAITSTPDPEQNRSYFTDGEFDYGTVATFFGQLHAAFAPRSANGGDIDRLQASAITGRNFIMVRLDRRESGMLNYSQFVIEAENDRDQEARRVIKFSQAPEETQLAATIRWVELVRTNLIQVVALLVLPVTIPTAVPVTPSVTPPLDKVPDSYVAQP